MLFLPFPEAGGKWGRGRPRGDVISPMSYLQLSIYTVYMYIYVYIYRERERQRDLSPSPSRFCHVIEEYREELEHRRDCVTAG